jgi:diguanylate cyclase
LPLFEPTMDSLFAQLSDSVSKAHTLEELTRPLLEMLSAVTGLESTYLTTVDEAKGVQHVLYARNAARMQIPEGLVVPWHDTLCKRALEENRPFTCDVGAVWGDSDAARELGIQTYVSTPVRVGDDELYGTLCAASSGQRPLTEEAQHALSLFARLIAQQVERERLVTELQQANEELKVLALTDWLTGLPNRRAVMIELRRALARAQRSSAWVMVGVIDLDGFKRINDEMGHEAGDAFLREMTLALTSSLRGGDVLGRLGGDEFAVVMNGPSLTTDSAELCSLLQRRLFGATIGEFNLGGTTLPYAGASVGVVCIDPRKTSVDEALQLADAEMYRIKNARRGAR